MSKITDSARGESCTFMLPGICNHDPATTVLCHAPHPDKGRGIKGPDSWAAYGCSACHDEMDMRTWNYFNQIETHLKILSRENDVMHERDSFWLYAIRETQRRLLAKGRLTESTTKPRQKPLAKILPRVMP